MGQRNLVLCLDGTDDFAAANPTHVYRLFRMLERSDRQLIYYDGGVGTLLEAKLLAKPLVALYRTIDLAAGFSIRENFIKAFEFLCDNFQEGDQIYMFGFSRGAYTARAVAAAVDYFGIPGAEHKNLIPFMWQRFSKCGEMTGDAQGGDNPFAKMANLKGALTEEGSARRLARIRFLGLWDTVSAFGLINLKTLPGTRKLKRVDTVRHAVSIDEKRNMFPENRVSSQHPDVKEVWFAGVHRDVGGGGASGKLELSMCAFQWIVNEATSLWIDTDKVNPQKVITCDPCGPHNGNFWLVAVYGVAGLAPMKVWKDRRGGGSFVLRWLKFWHTREIPDGAMIHSSVKERMDRIGYLPANLKRATNVRYVSNRQEEIV